MSNAFVDALPFLTFPHSCTNRSNPGSWNTLAAAKTRIIELVWAPNVNAGVRFCAVKFVQRVVLVQVRGVSDPRVRPYLPFDYKNPSF